MPMFTTLLKRRGWLAVAPAVLSVALFAATGAPSAHADSDTWHQPGESPYQFSNKRNAQRATPSYLGASDVEPVKKKRSSSAGSLANVDDEAVRKPRAQAKRVASLKKNDDGDSSGYSAKPKVSGGHVSWAASGSCLPGQLKSVIADVSQYGRVVVTSTGRDAGHNRSVGGASKSYHLGCQAADLRVHGNVASAASFLRNHGSVGGFHHYGGGLFHIDTGPKRSW
jgi:hypothetical protein